MHPRSRSVRSGSLAGKGLIFQSLPKIFSTLSGGMIFFFLFMLAIFFAGLPTCISLVEVPVTCLVDTLGWSRKKAVWVVTLICALGAIPCVWSDTFFALFDNLVGNVFYCLSAAVVAFYLAWIVVPRRSVPSGTTPPPSSSTAAGLTFCTSSSLFRRSFTSPSPHHDPLLRENCIVQKRRRICGVSFTSIRPIAFYK